VDERVQVRTHAENIGHLATYNEGLQWATADYVLILSADDLLTPGALQRALRVLDAHGDVSFVFGQGLTFETPDPPPLDILSEEFSYSLVSHEELLRLSCQLGHTPIQAPTVLVRNSIQKRAGGFLANLPHSGDTELWLRLALLGRIARLHAPQAFRRLHAKSMSNDFSSLERLQEQYKAFATHLHQFEAQINESQSFLTQLGQTIGEKAFWLAAHAFEEGHADLSKKCLSYAQFIWPAISSSPMWWRFRVKNALGAKRWMAL